MYFISKLILSFSVVFTLAVCTYTLSKVPRMCDYIHDHPKLPRIVGHLLILIVLSFAVALPITILDYLLTD